MALELYHNDMSTCAQKVRITLDEKSLEWNSRHLNLRAGDQQKPEYLKLNPRGVVPTLIDGGEVVRESNVIMEYLDDGYPEIALRPRKSLDRARMRLWTKRLDEGHHDIATGTLSVAIAFRFQVIERGEQAAEALIANIPDPIKRERRRDVIYNGMEARDFRIAVDMWEKLLGDMETTLRESLWLAGNSYSLADAAYTPYLTRLEHLRLLDWIGNRAKLSDWYDRVRARPSYDSAIRRWENPKYLDLMAQKGEDAWPRIRKIIET